MPDLHGKAAYETGIIEKKGYKAHPLDAPALEELPMTLECKLISYDPEETQYLFGEVVNVSADKPIFDGDGKNDADRPNSIIFVGVYAALHIKQ